MATPTVPPVVIPGGASSRNNILLNPLQRGNPILDCIRHVGKEFADIVADFQVGKTTGVLFLSLKYHRLHPEYIHTRIEKLSDSYSLRLLLIHSDVTEHKDPIRELTRICLINNITIIVAFSAEEAGHYLSTFKQFEHKPPDMIKERVDKDHHALFRSALTSINKINKTDVETLRTAYGSFAGISNATAEQLQDLPGFGAVKVKNLKAAFELPLQYPDQPTLDNIRKPLQTTARNDKGKSRAIEIDVEPDASGPNQGNPRQSSPEWDIERGLTPLPDGEFDIDLDLN